METAILATGVTKSYRTPGRVTPALKGVSLEVARGGFVSLVGPDGAGKTTLIKILCGMIKFDGGEVTVLGSPLPRGARQIKDHIGYLSQRFALYGNLTVGENVRYFARVFGVRDYGPRMERLLEAVNLSRFRDRLAKQLSGGMKQKLGVVCGLVHSPKILFLDEPTTGVDPVSRRELFAIIEEMVAGGLTVLMSTAYMDEAERARHVVMFNEGAVIAEGTPDTLATSSGIAAYDVATGDTAKAREALAGAPGVRSANPVGPVVHVIAGTEVTAGALLAALGGLEARIGRPRLTMEDLFVGRVLTGRSG